MVDGYCEETEVEIGGKDVRLLREVRRLAHNVVLALKDFQDVCRAVVAHVEPDVVANGNGVGAPDALEPEIALYPAIHDSAVCGAYAIDTARTLYYCSLHSACGVTRS